MEAAILGKLGEHYNFVFYDLECIPEKSGVYILFKRNHDKFGGVDILYIGQSENLRQRLHDNFESHDAYKCVQSHGFNCVGLFIMEGSTERQRLDVETDLRYKHITPCNKQ